MCSRLAGRLITSPVAFLAAGIADFVIWGLTALGRRCSAPSAMRRR